MAVSHLQLGHQAYLAGRYKEALQHYEETIKCMRGNAVLEYGQTGLDFTLYECEVWFNHGLCHSNMDHQALALQSFMNAHQSKMLVRHDVIDEAIKSNGKDFMPFAPADLKAYRPKRLPNLHGSSMLNSMTGLHTPVPSILSDTLCGSRRVVAVAKGELSPNLVDFGFAAKRVSTVSSLQPSQSERYIKFSYPGPSGLVFKYARMESSADEIIQRLSEKAGKSDLRFKYQDFSGDWIYLFDDDDLAIALESCNDGIIHLRAI